MKKQDLIYREFQDSDLDELTLIIAHTWYRHLDLEKAMLCAKAEAMLHLARASRGVSALHDGKLMGVGFARMGDCGRADMWQKKVEDLIAENRHVVDIADEISIMYDEEILMEEVRKTHGHKDIGDLELLVVSPDAKGMGIGGTLMNHSLDWLKDQGAKGCRLVTDDGCDWEFYEHRGLNRLGEKAVRIPSADLYTKHAGDFHIYVYEKPLP